MSTDQSPKPVVKSTDNLDKIREDIAKGYDKINAATVKRGEANAAIEDVLAGLEAKGISKKAMRMAMTYVEMSESDQRGFDIAYTLSREALGAPVQADMFDGEAE